MDHVQFKTSQTAADYVAGSLEISTLEAFEQHMMSCPECVEDVETWRTIKLAMPKSEPAARTAPGRRVPAFTDWRMAASLLGAGVVGAAGGWLGKPQTADIDSSTLVFNVPAVSRGAAECADLRLAPDTQLAVLRVPGVSRDLKVVALDSQGRELPEGNYAVRMQPDGSRLLRIASHLLDGRAIHLEARGADGSSEPLGCVTGETGAANR